MNTHLQNKNILVTGASSGLGLATLHRLLDEGAIVYTVSRRNTLPLSPNHFPFSADITQPHTHAQWIQQLPPTLHGILLNAGGPPAGDATEMQMQHWDEAYQQVFRWKPALLNALLPRLKASGCAHILLSESISVKHPIDHLVLSNSMRMAITGYSKTLARELAPTGITCNVIAPGYHDTPAMERLFARKQAESGLSHKEVRHAFENQIPMQRMGTPEEFSALAVFLLSDLSNYITGQVMGIDGGLSTMPL